jgi:hypothetical protein
VDIDAEHGAQTVNALHRTLRNTMRGGDDRGEESEARED